VGILVLFSRKKEPKSSCPKKLTCLLEHLLGFLVCLRSYVFYCPISCLCALPNRVLISNEIGFGFVQTVLGHTIVPIRDDSYYAQKEAAGLLKKQSWALVVPATAYDESKKV